MKRKLAAGLAIMGLLVTLTGCKGDSGAIKATADEKGNYIVNGSFEDAELTGWTLNNVDNVTEELGVYERETDCYDGVQCLHFYSSRDVNFTVEQSLKGLEKGNYKLTGYAQGDTAGDANSSIYIYAIVNGETIKADITLNGYLAWNAAELNNLNITDGKVTIGISVTNAPGGWGTIDNISLIKE
ncbi:arabinogalactan endo-1,4-beta-galactosidase [Anaerotaenia torta]|uniref:hypothetical protein n=1 Tax=Anaerotaenia torta TaxID=433293 RepID=UPI003D202D90